MADADKIAEMKEPYAETGVVAPVYGDTYNDQADMLRLGKKQEFKASPTPSNYPIIN